MNTQDASGITNATAIDGHIHHLSLNMRVIGIISVRQLETGVGTILILTSVALNIVFRAAYFDHVVALTMGAEYFLIAGHQVTPKIGRALDLSIMQNLCLAHYRLLYTRQG